MKGLIPADTVTERGKEGWGGISVTGSGSSSVRLCAVRRTLKVETFPISASHVFHAIIIRAQIDA